MNSLISLLRNIGLSEKESQVYLISLKVGTNPASIIAKHAELNRCTTYSVLESLVNKGLVSHAEKEKIRFYTALPPLKLINYIDEKKRDLTFYKTEIESNIHIFQSFQHKENPSPRIQSFSGSAGIMQGYHSIIQEKSLSIWGVPTDMPNEFFYRFAPEFLKTSKSIKVLHRLKSQIIRQELKSMDDIKKMKNVQPVELVSNSKVLVVSNPNPYAVEIINSDIVKFFQNEFDILWKNKRALQV